MTAKPETTAAPTPSDAALIGALRALLHEDAAGTTGGAQGAVLGPDEQYRKYQEAQAKEVLARPPHELQHVKCKSPATGSTFTAVVDVNPSTKFPRGRVVRLDDYEKPTDAEEKVPKPLQARDRAYWLWTNYWQKDLSAFVGQELNVMARVDAVDRIAELERELAAAKGSKASEAPAASAKP